MGAADTPDGAGPADIHNRLSGVTGSVVQAGAVHGNITFYEAGPARETPVPHQVPLPTARFVNRDREFAAIDGLLAAPGPAVPITLLTGLPGVGKSSFAHNVAARRRLGYAGGDLYVNFAQSRDRQATAVGDALTACLRALGVEDAVMPDGVAARASLYRTLTAQRPMLVVLDDVTEPAQVLALVPNAPGSAVLVTSNDQLSELLLDGAEPMPLEPLDAGSGARLVAEFAGLRVAGEPDALAELVRLCGGLPVALRVAAARLRARPSLGVAGLVAEIADESRGLGAFTLRGDRRVVAVFDLSYGGLPPEVARLYRLLGLVPAPEFTVDLAAAAAGLPPADAEALLDHLVEVSLLGREDAGRFRFHNLVRRHARERALALDPEPERDAALRRVLDHVLVRAAFADRAALGAGRLRITPHETLLAGLDDPFAGDERRALDWLDAERPTAQALVRAAVGRGWFDPAWQLAESMTAVCVVRRYLVDWAEFTEWGVRAARVAGRSAAEARLGSFGSRAWTELGDPERARAELAAALALAEPLGAPRLLASIWELVGRQRNDAGDHAGAVAAYGRALAVFDGAEDRRGAAFVTMFLGSAQLDLGEAGTAAATLLRACELIHEVGSRRMEGRARTALGVALGRLGRGDEAGAAFGAAITLLAEGGYRFHEAAAHEAFAEFAAGRGEVELAEAALRRAIALHEDMRGPRAAELRARLSGGGSSAGSAGSPGRPGS